MTELETELSVQIMRFHMQYHETCTAFLCTHHPVYTFQFILCLLIVNAEIPFHLIVTSRLYNMQKQIYTCIYIRHMVSKEYLYMTNTKDTLTDHWQINSMLYSVHVHTILQYVLYTCCNVMQLR